MTTFHELKKRCYPKQKDPDLIFQLHRPISLPFLWLITKTNITGNHLSLASIFLAFPIALLIALGNSNMVLWGCILLQVLLQLDVLDGSVARFRKELSNYGAYLETLFHDIAIPLVFLALSIYSYRFMNSVIPLFFGMLLIFSIYVTNMSRLSKYKIVLSHIVKKKKIPTSNMHFHLESVHNQSFLQKLIVNVIFIFNSVGHLFTIILLSALFGVLEYVIFFYAIFFFALALVKLFIEIRQKLTSYGL